MINSTVCHIDSWSNYQKDAKMCPFGVKYDHWSVPQKTNIAVTFNSINPGKCHHYAHYYVQSVFYRGEPLLLINLSGKRSRKARAPKQRAQRWPQCYSPVLLDVCFVPYCVYTLPKQTLHLTSFHNALYEQFCRAS